MDGCTPNVQHFIMKCKVFPGCPLKHLALATARDRLMDLINQKGSFNVPRYFPEINTNTHIMNAP